MADDKALDLLKRMHEWEEVHDVLVDLLSYWQSKPKSLPQIHAVVSLKHTLRLITDDLL